MAKEKPSQPAPQNEQEILEEQKAEREQAERPARSAKRASAARRRLVQRQRNSLRAGLAVVAGRTAGAVSRRLHLGGGTSIVGVVAQRVYPEIVAHLATQLEHGSVLVTGTNGKTTTSGFISAILRDGGLRVWRNREGSNLMRGVASSLVIRALPNGNLKRSGRAISILEADEAALPQIVSEVPPRVVIFTNLFRDQLDRYGEVDSILDHWRKAIDRLPESTTLVMNADDPAIAELGQSFRGKVLYYGIEDRSLDLLVQPVVQERHQTIDTRVCPTCGHEYSYDARFYSHMGHYYCATCGTRRPQPQVLARRVEQKGFDRLHMLVEVEGEQKELVVPLPGLYNVYNALAAIAAALALGIDWEPISSGIGQFKPVFGRGERIQTDGRTLRLLLAKNPTGFNEVLRTLFSDSSSRHVLFVLNDNIADGQDISWIWDVDFERVIGQTKTLTVSGTRAL
ncbi:MAG: DUF1727 domain-containing protein, partial [Ktedonobacteraceae bacterium]|nr:DUF1727 domain-containing protein [Ktedonobacteraceae bacterium]